MPQVSKTGCDATFSIAKFGLSLFFPGVYLASGPQDPLNACKGAACTSFSFWQLRLEGNRRNDVSNEMRPSKLHSHCRAFEVENAGLRIA